MSIILVIDKDMQELAEDYLANRRKEVLQIQELLAKEDLAKIASLAHNIKGNAKMYGFPELTKLGEKLEIAAENKKTSDVLQLVQSLADYLNGLELSFA